MSVKIRLSRTGRNKICTYRIVVADSRTKRDGAFVENLGHYCPQKTPKEFNYKVDRMAHWLAKGAEPSQTIATLLAQDNFSQKAEAAGKGVDLATLAKPLPERARTKKRKEKKAD